MSHATTALVVSPGITYVTRDATPYRSDHTGIVHVAAAHASELTAQSAPKNQHGDVVGAAPRLATVSDLAGTIHAGASLTWTAENGG